MRITWAQSGGIGYFPGLQKPITIDVDQLSPADAAELRRLLEATGFFDLPAAVGVPAQGAADYQHYIVTVEDKAQRHTVRFLVPIADPSLQDLIQTLQTHVRAAR